MKQGRANSNSYDAKREPVPHRVNVVAVSRLGNKIGTHTEEGEVRNPTGPLESGRGFAAPAPVMETSHKSGSQGRH